MWSMETVSTNLDVGFIVYGREEFNILIIQQRSPVLNVCNPIRKEDPFSNIWDCIHQVFKQEFINSLLKFAQDASFASILFLSGMSPTNRTDAQMLYATSHLNIDVYQFLSIVLDLQHIIYIPSMGPHYKILRLRDSLNCKSPPTHLQLPHSQSSKSARKRI
jgi:hypothetical protein